MLTDTGTNQTTNPIPIPVPEQDAWLYQNPEALSLFQEGLQAAAEGRVQPPADFSEFAGLDDEDEDGGG